ncbi:UNVERIFIED_CONTAM: hypothetical protein Slati_2203100 [Sesamum latifolium]|uniref:Uncharacterized protein n=1 Tax=Sesamum latifolium TaxID=2727402 RepID=A0AAW2WSL6_9LAMI
MSAHSLIKMMRRKVQNKEGELFPNHKVLSKKDGDPQVLKLLQQYDDIFQEPRSLPPERNIQHCIELLPDAIPKKQHPYIYTYGQKTEIERIVKEMLNSGIIRLRQLCFPSMLVKKKDGGWRLC